MCRDTAGSTTNCIRFEESAGACPRRLAASPAVRAELVVHGWVHIDGEMHLRLTLTVGTIGCLPADAFESSPE